MVCTDPGGDAALAGSAGHSRPLHCPGDHAGWKAGLYSAGPNVSHEAASREAEL